MKNSMPRIYTLQNFSKDWKIFNLGMTIYEKVLTACLEIHGITFNSGLGNGENVFSSLGKYWCVSPSHHPCEHMMQCTYCTSQNV